jgi:F-type H+-transporting ATPase subunit gamma
MAGNLIHLRRRIRSVRNTQKITKAMKTVSAAKLRRAVGDLNRARPFVDRIAHLLHEVGGERGQIQHPLLSPRNTGKVVLVVISADKGLCGAYNSKLLKKAEDLLQDFSRHNETVEIVAVGSKATRHFSKRGLPVRKGFPNFMARLSYAQAQQLSEYLQQLFLNEEVKAVEFIYTAFLSSARQQLASHRVFPVSFQDLEGADANQGTVEYILEPGAEQIVQTLLPRFVHMRIFKLLLEALASEHVARMVAMDLATRNASDMIRSLTLTMNKLRQASITKELLEIITATEALSK